MSLLYKSELFLMDLPLTNGQYMVLFVLWLVYELCSLVSLDVSSVSVGPPVALDMGVGLLCQLLRLWEQVPAGLLTLVECLLGEGESDAETGTAKPTGLVRI